MTRGHDGPVAATSTPSPTAPQQPEDADSSAFFETAVAATALGGSGAHIPEHEALELLSDRYRLSGTVERIATEKDDTFRLVTTEQDYYLVKVSPAEEDPLVVDLQTAAMRHVTTHAPELPVPRVIDTSDGQNHVVIASVDGPHPRILRVMEFIRGDTLSRVHPSGAQLQSIGAMLGRLSLALRGFDHPAADRLVLWDVANFHRLGVLREYLSDPLQLELTDRIFDAYRKNVVPELGNLETQVIHGDYSPFNVVVDPASDQFVTGIIDFGDTVRSAVIFDVSVGMANQLDGRLADPWDTALSFLKGYREVRDIATAEIDLLAFTAPARLLMRGLITAWRASQNPERHDYLMSHAIRDWDNLSAGLEVPLDRVQAQLRATAPTR